MNQRKKRKRAKDAKTLNNDTQSTKIDSPVLPTVTSTSYNPPRLYNSLDDRKCMLLL